MDNNLKLFLKENSRLIEGCLPSHIERLEAPTELKNAMLYSIQAGGKRIRPMLLLATLTSFQKPVEVGLDMACAIEMIHTYSLIHDDLPAMDDDDMRRGKPTNHKVFGEALAILAGDALLTYSFELIANLSEHTVSPEQKLKLVLELAKASGPEGMVGGQVADMQGESKSLSLEELVYVHQHKTGDLLTASIVAGAIIAGAKSNDIEYLRLFAQELGLVFQIKDDILDVEGNEKALGKRVGSDRESNKSTYPNLLGMDGAKSMLNEHMKKALDYLQKIDIDRQLLTALTEYIASRDH